MTLQLPVTLTAYDIQTQPAIPTVWVNQYYSLDNKADYSSSVGTPAEIHKSDIDLSDLKPLKKIYRYR